MRPLFSSSLHYWSTFVCRMHAWIKCNLFKSFLLQRNEKPFSFRLFSYFYLFNGIVAFWFCWFFSSIIFQCLVPSAIQFVEMVNFHGSYCSRFLLSFDTMSIMKLDECIEWLCFHVHGQWDTVNHDIIWFVIYLIIKLLQLSTSSPFFFFSLCLFFDVVSFLFLYSQALIIDEWRRRSTMQLNLALV